MELPEGYDWQRGGGRRDGSAGPQPEGYGEAGLDPNNGPAAATYAAYLQPGDAGPGALDNSHGAGSAFDASLEEDSTLKAHLTPGKSRGQPTLTDVEIDPKTLAVALQDLKQRCPYPPTQTRNVESFMPPAFLQRLAPRKTTPIPTFALYISVLPFFPNTIRAIDAEGTVSAYKRHNEILQKQLEEMGNAM